MREVGTCPGCGATVERATPLVDALLTALATHTEAQPATNERETTPTLWCRPTCNHQWSQ